MPNKIWTFELESIRQAKEFIEDAKVYYKDDEYNSLGYFSTFVRIFNLVSDEFNDHIKIGEFRIKFIDSEYFRRILDNPEPFLSHFISRTINELNNKIFS